MCQFVIISSKGQHNVLTKLSSLTNTELHLVTELFLEIGTQ